MRNAICILILLTKFSFAIRLPSTELNLERRREKEEKIRELQEEYRTKKDRKDTPLNEIEESEKEKGTPIKKIIFEGNFALKEKEIESLAKSYIGKRGGNNILNLMKEIENLYLKKGYIATRVKIDMQSSDIKNGVVKLRILEGKIEKIIFKNKSYTDNIKRFSSFPSKEGDIINIKDLDQGIDNINSVSSNNAKFNLIPGTEIGKTIVEIENKKHKKISGTINYNNLGQKITGVDRVKAELTISDIIGFNESLSGGYQTKLGKKKGNYGSNFFFHYKIPFKYWNFSVKQEQSEYFIDVYGLNRLYKTNGISRNTNYRASRVLTRDSNKKLSLAINLTLKETKNYIENVKLITSSRRTTIFRTELTLEQKLWKGILHTNIGYYKGVKWFGAKRDKGVEDEPKAQYSKYVLDLSWYRPFKIKEQNFSYRFSLGGQYSDDILYPSEKIGIGDDTTVRGFKENSIMGDSGIYIRNELSYNYKILEPFVAYDIGMARNNYKTIYDATGDMSGVSIGLRLFFKGITGSITYSKAISSAKYVKKNSHEVYASFSYSF